MNPERWQRVKDLFHSALDLDADARVSFLEDACGDDAALQAEVRSLLDAHQESSIFDKPAFEVASELLGDETDDPLLGGELGPYRVLSTLGRGGMGVVYLAEDTRLRRPVAIKALPPEFTDDDRFRARLRQEAMTTAALSHPGIATVFALEDIDNHLYLVREYVAGETLRDLLADGPVPMDVLLDVAVDIGRALEAAHAGGVIHRDLKPENVMRTPQAVVKVLDFGLARFERLSSDTDDGVRLTRLGAAIGTPGYMSPEQLRGDPVDARTDHFSLGVVLYELATAQHPFEGGDSVATMARVLSSAPQPVVSLRPDCPPALATVIDRCLQKAATDRFPSTQVLVGELEAARVPAQPPSLLRTKDQPAVSAEDGGPFWWWQFHQLTVSAVFALLLIPLWLVRDVFEDPWKDMLFLVAVAVVGWACTLRLHLLFTSRVYPEELLVQRHRTERQRAWADTAFVTVLLVAAGFAVTRQEGRLAGLFVVAAVTLGILGRVIEPATTRAAFSKGKPPNS